MSTGIEGVIKVGGGLLASPPDFIDALSAISDVARRSKILVVPGGGPFADAVRAVDRQIGLSDDDAHWMAVLGMDQYAHVLASRLHGAALVHDPETIRHATRDGRVPVLAPSAWLRSRDPLPHTWDVTSDSIAAWVARELGAARLMLVKPTQASEPLADPNFTQALGPHVASTIVRAGASLRSALAAW